MITEKAMEQKLRRTLESVGYSLRKSRTHNIHLNDLGGYQIVDPWYNIVIWGSDFELSLEDVTLWAKGIEE